MVKALVVVFLLALVIKDYLAYHFFINYQSLSRAPSLANLIDTTSPARLKQAIFLDSGNAEYHNALGNYYTQKMTEAWKQGGWRLIQGRWVFMPGENTRFYGLKALHSYEDAVHFSPANAWYHFYLGWTLNELQRLSEYSGNPMPPNKFLDAKKEFTRALMLDPNNNDIKKYINAVKRKE
jgi:tetratricopeptide (TPR) repeat protein